MNLALAKSGRSGDLGSFTNKANMNEYYKRSTSTDIAFGKGPDQLNATDIGINLLAGIELNSNVKLGLNYGQGFSNITNDGTSAKNSVFSLIVGYNFK